MVNNGSRYFGYHNNVQFIKEGKDSFSIVPLADMNSLIKLNGAVISEFCVVCNKTLLTIYHNQSRSQNRYFHILNYYKTERYFNNWLFLFLYKLKQKGIIF